jgi:hypothetical protein
MNKTNTHIPTLLLLLLLLLQTQGCTANDEPPPPQRTPSEGVSATVERVRAESDGELDDRYFDMDQIGKRFEIIGESFADFGLGFESRVIALRDDRLSSVEGSKPKMGRLLIETAADRYKDYVIIVDPHQADSWQLVADGKARTIEKLKPILGEWNGYFFVHDHNSNGVDEIVHFAAGGVQYIPMVWEYQDGELKEVLDAASHVSISLLVEMPQPGTVIVYHTLLNTGEEEYLRETFVWNEQSGRYEHTNSEPVDSVPE